MASKIVKRDITVECEFNGMKVILRGTNEVGKDVEITTKLVTRDKSGGWEEVVGTAKEFIMMNFKQSDTYKKCNDIIGQALI